MPSTVLIGIVLDVILVVLCFVHKFTNLKGQKHSQILTLSKKLLSHATTTMVLLVQVVVELVVRLVVEFLLQMLAPSKQDEYY